MNRPGRVGGTVAEINELFPSIYKKFHARLVRSSPLRGCTLRTLHFLNSLNKLGRSGVKETAAALGLSASTVSTLAKRTERRGLIRRHRAAGDERRVELDLTSAGKRIIRGVPPLLEPGMLTFALRRIGAVDRKKLLDGLRKLDAVDLSTASAVEHIARKRVTRS